jgi:hypothetical protein
MDNSRNHCGVAGCLEDISFACTACPSYLCWEHYLTEDTTGRHCEPHNNYPRSVTVTNACISQMNSDDGTKLDDISYPCNNRADISKPSAKKCRYSAGTMHLQLMKEIVSIEKVYYKRRCAYYESSGD